MDEVNKVASSEKFEAAAKKAKSLLAEDKLDEANQAYISLIPDDKLTPAECFVLGNTFFSMEDDLALKYQQRALAALPDDPHVNLEYAMDLHRQGKAKEALPHYEKYLSKGKSGYLPHTLLADCLVRTGRLKEACEQWKLADHPNNHTEIDFAIHSIYGAALPFKRRSDLLKAIHAGQVNKLDELFALSANWDRDWWNADVNPEMLKKDVALAKEILAGDAEHFAELEVYAETYTQEVTPKWLEEKLKAKGWILGEAGKLPSRGHVADRLVSLVLEHELEKEATLLKRFEAELRNRALGKDAKDIMALNMLAHLLASDEKLAPQLAEIDQAGWERYHDDRFAASLLVGLLGTDKLKTDSPQFIQAMKDFPENEFIAMMGVEMAEKEGKPMSQPLVEAIKAEFRHLSISIGIIKDSYRLKGLFALLEKELGK
ncbi:tetratricopeptide repeat protein [Prosthecobacter sp.]|uniref:tetratricopeptide repeat protein n=1 Tax=Prosthecobacter sp. TaxID=1965333 RepID=UPI0037841905